NSEISQKKHSLSLFHNSSPPGNKKEDGQVTACYLIFYSIGRFVIEFFRGDIIRGSVGILSTSQFISIFTGIAGIVLLIRIRKKRDSKSSV
ncbi:MAG: hypothetical protein EGR88_00130, partial [Ruminococcus sp. SR1/5]|nr:hypothetical protein [Ruminococcus sp.]